MDVFTWLWLALLGAGGVLEIVALIRERRGDTLSEHIWRWFAVTDPRRSGWTQVRRVALLVAMTWLTVHFVTGGHA